MKECPECIIALSESQCLRFIDEINGKEDINENVREIQRKIRATKKLPRSRETKTLIDKYYDCLYSLQFQKDYLCVIMESNSDYDRANKGFTVDYGIVDGAPCKITYRRFLGTNGGIKNSTIVYVNEDIYPELKKRLDNGRDMDKELVPAKLEAYQALICSGSTSIPEPNGIIVVKDCITHFKEDVILISDENDGEPELSYVNDYEFEHNDSDGFGLMLPSYAQKVNEYLTGGSDPISGMNTRAAWDKGMLYTFDFIEFAEKVAGTYEIVDAWGDTRDIRNAEVILTVSMLKLWNSYPSWEEYQRNCIENNYQFSTPKITPETLENVRMTNYQFLQSYDFTDEELLELCQPTIDEIKDVLGLDYRKSLVYLCGYGLNENNVFGENTENYIKALMADERMINDPFIRKKIWHMIKTRIEWCAKGSITLEANFAMISGDPYALAQSMFGLETTGLLKAGEVYHKYWIDKGSDEIVCFRAPMTCHNNIRKMKLCKNNDAAYWYRYIKTALIYNCWDSACDAMNGADKDGDTNMCTDNPILLRKTKNLPTIVCLQKSAKKTVPTEEDIIAANKLAFNDDIGTITNRITAMFEIQAGFAPGSKEYQELEYRIMCGQHFQQCSIDRAKGIIAKPMPESWYSYRGIKTSDEADADEVTKLEFTKSLVADRKPYFMIYIYPNLRKEYRAYLKDSNSKISRKYWKLGIKTLEDLEKYPNKTDEMNEIIANHYKYSPVGYNPCVVNRICWLFEKEFKNYLSKQVTLVEFDHSILKSDATYRKSMYNKVYKIYKDYLDSLKAITKKTASQKIEIYELGIEKELRSRWFQLECDKACSNEDELANILIDMLYKTDLSKQFCWDICGDAIVKNLLLKSNGEIHYPQLADVEEESFQYAGRKFYIKQKIIED